MRVLRSISRARTLALMEDPGTVTLRRRFRPADDRQVDGVDFVLRDFSYEQRPERIKRIVLTGGPGGGKSTAASFLMREFANDLWVLPEAATVLYREGMPRGDSPRGIAVAQKAIFDVQRAFEQAGAEQHPERVQLCDRATVDGAAYWPDGADDFFAMMGTTREEELARYDAVIFLRTAAMLPAGYERDMTVRTEERDDALELDAKVFELYRDHPHVVTIRSTASFLEKIHLVTAAVRKLTGVTAY
jgi:predicted ATPase